MGNHGFANTLNRQSECVVKLVSMKMSEIEDLFSSLPEKAEGIEVLTKERSKYYLESFKARFERFLLPLAN